MPPMSNVGRKRTHSESIIDSPSISPNTEVDEIDSHYSSRIHKAFKANEIGQANDIDQMEIEKLQGTAK